MADHGQCHAVTPRACNAGHSAAGLGKRAAGFNLQASVQPQHVTQGLFKDPGNKLGLDLRLLESMTNLAIEGPVQSPLTSTGVFSLTLMSFGSGPDAPRPDVIVCHGGQRNPLSSGQGSDE